MPDSFKKIILFALIAFGLVLSANLSIYLWEILAILGFTIKVLLLLAFFYLTLQAFFVWYTRYALLPDSYRRQPAFGFRWH